MASIHLSPGVYWKEIDLSNYIPSLSTTIAAIVGTASKGPVNQRTFIGSAEQFIQKFGIPSQAHLGVVAALEFFKEGNQLWFTRVESSTTPAVAAKAGTAPATVWEAKDPGTYYNGYNIQVTYGLPRNAPTVTVAYVVDQQNYTISFGTYKNLAPGSVKLVVGTGTYTDNGLGVLVPATGSPALTSSTVSYDTGTVTVVFNAAPANDIIASAMYYTAFNVSINKTVNNKLINVETYNNMNLVAGTENHYATKMQYTNFVKIPTLTAFPTAGTFTFSGGTDGTDGITDYDYIGIRDSGISSGLQSYANAEEVDINVIACPGQSSIEVRQSLIGIAEGRKDTIALLDPAQGMAIQDVVDWADGENTFAAYNSVNSTYSAIYYDWYKYTDAYNQTSYWAPPSGVALRAFAKSEYWEAPAGPNRGTMQDVTQMAQSLTQGDRDFLYSNRINPITDLPGYGIVIFGQRTGSMYPTSLDRVAVRRTLIVIEKAVTTALFPMLFEPNNMVTWKRAERLIQPFLDHMVTTNRIYEGKVVCNATTNTPAVIDQNQMVVNVFLKMMKYSEQIMVNFILVPTGADISEYVGQSF